MINLSKDNSDIKMVIQEEKDFLTSYLKSQERINGKIHIVLRKLVDNKVVSSLEQSQTVCDELSIIVKTLKKSHSNIYSVQRLLKKLNMIILENPEYEERINIYNKVYSGIFNDIVKTTSELEAFLSEHSNIIKSAKVETPVDTKVVDEELTDENVLLISEIDKKVVLPYTMEELNNILAENPDKYETIKEVIDRVYTKPLKYYHNASLMRFKEAFKLVRERENGTFSQALDLALELFSNHSLHPAVITACKNLNELDVYLSCLEYNELNDFHFFKMIFKMAPLKSKTIKI